jgi:ParB-like chromosome segregation protein Spo0J
MASRNPATEIKGKSGMTNPADKVEQWPINKLVPYARNARTHSDEQVGQIAASIREWGWTTPILVDEEGSIIAGHGRTLAAQRLKMTEVPVMVAAGWSDAKKRAYVLADNKLAMNAGWDPEMLKIELGALDAAGFDLELTGFVGDDLTQAMFGDLATEDQDDELSENYSRKIEAPIYTPKGEKPRVSSLYDESKATELKLQIAEADLPADVRKFLIAAADRHTVFDFRNIAEFYAHADAATQDLMERSALVIIDYDKAIENGFVELSQAMLKQAGKFKPKAGTDDAE